MFNKLNNKNILYPYDLNLPSKKENLGVLHPISLAIKNIKKFFLQYNFTEINGPEIESSFYNFKSINISKNHPSYNNKDTFWLSNISLLRTQTSSIQMRIIKYKKIPIKVISIGKVYRKDKEDYIHTPMFHQLEGLIIDKNITFIDLLSIVKEFLNFYFEQKLNFNIRPSYFPFTEPSAEIDIFFSKKNKWIEILGCGLIHPNILRKIKIEKKYNGIAFGVGIERLLMLKYHINDIRLLYDNNIRFLKQFTPITYLL